MTEFQQGISNFLTDNIDHPYVVLVYFRMVPSHIVGPFKDFVTAETYSEEGWMPEHHGEVYVLFPPVEVANESL